MKKSLLVLFGAALLPLLLLVAILGLTSRVTAQEIMPGTPFAPSAAQAPSIVVTMTVGIDPSVCATMDSINLPIGGDSVYYCYEVTNTGNVTLTRHSLVDTELDTILTAFPFVLVPGASAFLTQTAVVSATTVSTATWTAFNPGPVDEASASASATVVVTESMPSIVIAMTVGIDPSVCAATDSVHLPVGGNSVYYCYEVTNTGNVTLTRHSLVDTELDTILTAFPFVLVPGASAFLTQSAVISATTASAATWTAFNPGPIDEASATDNAIVYIGYPVYLPAIRNE